MFKKFLQVNSWSKMILEQKRRLQRPARLDPFEFPRRKQQEESSGIVNAITKEVKHRFKQFKDARVKRQQMLNLPVGAEVETAGAPRADMRARGAQPPAA